MATIMLAAIKDTIPKITLFLSTFGESFSIIRVRMSLEIRQINTARAKQDPAFFIGHINTKES